MYGGNFHFYVAIPILPIGWKRAVEERRRRKKSRCPFNRAPCKTSSTTQSSFIDSIFSSTIVKQAAARWFNSSATRGKIQSVTLQREKSQQWIFTRNRPLSHDFPLIFFFAKQIITLDKEIISPFFQNKTKKFTSVKIVA